MTRTKIPKLIEIYGIPLFPKRFLMNRQYPEFFAHLAVNALVRVSPSERTGVRTYTAVVRIVCTNEVEVTIENAT